MVSNFTKKRNKPFSKHNFYYILGGIFFVFFSAWLIFTDIKNFKEKKKLDSQLKEYQEQVNAMSAQNESLKEGIAQAKDSNYVEKVAREELGLQKEGEKVITFIMPETKAQEEKKPENFFQNFLGWLSRAWSGIFHKTARD